MVIIPSTNFEHKQVKNMFRLKKPMLDGSIFKNKKTTNFGSLSKVLKSSFGF